MAGFAVVSFGSAQIKARDAQRKADLDAVFKALELAKTDSQGGQYYPTCSTNGGAFCPIEPSDQTTLPELSPDYIKTLPQDPKYSGGNCASYPLDNTYCYAPSSSGIACTGNVGATPCNQYNMFSCLENKNALIGNNVYSVSSVSCTSERALSLNNP